MCVKYGRICALCANTTLTFSLCAFHTNYIFAPTKTTPTTDFLDFWHVRFHMCSIGVSRLRILCEHHAHFSFSCVSNIFLFSSQNLQRLSDNLWPKLVRESLQLTSNVPQTHLKRISNVNTSSTRASTHLKNSEDFWKRKLSSVRPFAIPLSTQIFLQGRLPQSRVRDLGVRRCNA